MSELDPLDPETRAPGERATPRERVREELVALPVWKKVALGVAALFVLAGLALSLAGGGETAPDAGGEGDAPRTANTFRDAPTSTDGAEAAEESPWTPFLLKGGFSFFAGFSIGFALRTFFKVSAAAIGFLLLVLFGLGYAGVIEVDWTAISGYYDSAVEALKAELGGFRSFVAGSLPSAGLAGLGLFAGFKRG